MLMLLLLLGCERLVVVGVVKEKRFWGRVRGGERKAEGRERKNRGID